MNSIRTPSVAGLFYPADLEKLQNNIGDLLESTKTEKEYKNIFGIVAPHAGYTYSGRTAAHVYNLLKGKKYERVVIISPSHNEYFPGSSVFNGSGYQTPLGILEIDDEFVIKLVENSKSIFRGIEGHRSEHALEVQLPFLQTVLNDFKIIPVVMGDQGKIFVDELAEKLAEIVDDETLIVASSDMSHFHSKLEADKLDSIVEDRINRFDYKLLQSDLEKNNTEACGGGPIVTLMKAASLRNKNHSFVIHRSDSGDVNGENEEVVGYLSAVIYGD
ncbi:MAG: AmmeMemoRadiSam system protein B [Ignavibacteriaceae bacterium]